MNLAMLKEGKHKIQHDSIYIKLKSKQNYVVEGYEGDKSKKKKHDCHRSQNENYL